MAAATTTVLGEIVLAGDLTGDANSPQLRASGVTPGTYAPVQRMSVDSKGRITSIGQMTTAELTAFVPDATSVIKGIFSVGTGLSASSGAVTFNFSTFNSAISIATGSVFGLVKSGTNITNTSGVMSIPDATGSVSGVVKSGTNITNTAGVLSIADATSSIKGAFSLGNGISATAGAAAIDCSTFPASGSVFGFVKSGTNITNTAGVLSIADATSSVKGVASFGTGLTVTTGVVTPDYSTITSNVPDATSVVKGIASYSTDFTVTAGAVTVNYTNLTANLPVATGSVFGKVKSGTNITNTAGVLSIPDATNAVKGVCSVNTASGLSISSGLLNIPNAVKSGSVNTYTAAQNGALTTTTLGGTTFTPNFQTDAGSTLITLSGNLTINFPSTLAPAGCVVREDILLKYSTSGTYVVTLSGTYLTNKTLTFTNLNVNATDVLTLICTDTVCYAILNETFL